MELKKSIFGKAILFCLLDFELVLTFRQHIAFKKRYTADMKMNHLLHQGLSCIATLVYAGMMAHAEYAPNVHVEDYPKDEVQKGVRALRALTSLGRDSFIAEVLGLMFTKDGTAYDWEAKSHPDGYRYYWAKDGALFVAGTGRVYDRRKDVFEGNATKESAKMKKASQENWKIARQVMHEVGEETILSFFSRDVTRIVQQTAKYHLKKLPTKLREEILAELAGLCYMPDGSSARGEKLAWTRHGTLNLTQKVETWELKSGACFMDSQGKEQKIDEVRKRYSRNATNEELIRWCANLLGEKDILSMFAKDVKTLRSAYEQKMQQLGVKTAEKPAEQKTQKEETLELSAQVGATYRPDVDTSRMSAAYRNELKEAASYLRSLPKVARWTFMSERLGLLFFPQSGAVGISTWGWMEDGSHFIGADGSEYDARSELKVLEDRGGRAEWNKNSDAVERLGREAVFAQFPEEVAELVLQNAKYELEKMGEKQPVRRDMFLAWVAELLYTAEGEPIQSTEVTVAGAHKKPIRVLQIGADSKFTDTKGEEWSVEEVVEKYGRPHHDRWSILETCTHHIGRAAIRALFTQEIKKLRTNYEKKQKEFEQ